MKKITFLVIILSLMMIIGQSCSAISIGRNINWDLSADANHISQVDWPAVHESDIYWIGGPHRVTVQLPNGHALEQLETQHIYVNLQDETSLIIGSVLLQTENFTLEEARVHAEQFLHNFNLADDDYTQERLQNWYAHWHEYETEPKGIKAVYDFDPHSDFGTRIYLTPDREEGPSITLATWESFNEEKPWRFSYTISYPDGWHFQTD
ncbi:MAG: hypothetical protein AAGD96_24655 [Chloroflexota bacterium]